MLLALVSSQRQRTLQLLDIVNMEITCTTISFTVTALIKQSRPGNVGHRLILKAYPPDKRLCIYTYVIEYLNRTKSCRGKEKRLFVSFKKPHGRVTTDTIGRWLKTVLSSAGDRHLQV
ncbi:hypothetical protein HOLleu_03455 [Holothuria leucospilota]|uniref:Uncharacterized protein n=1 Tax=Holothuria leucospilota TaxID=206669 RepID=A0A9Q1CTG9_HOLLE|nr:hypothetical protein HOLleu_03455 [Holothuria leucospilota]